jgi:translation initiation factor 2D
MEKLGYIKLKKVQQDVVVFSVNAMHPHVQQHVDYKTLQDKADQAKEATVKEVHVQGIIVQDVYKPLNTLTEVFKETKSAKQLYTASELKAILNEYIQLHQLADSHDPRNVRLDARLFHGVLNKEERAKNIEVMTRPELVKRFVDCMHSMYWIHLPGSIEPTLRKGKIKPIEIKVETRRGRKQITLINHVDVFGLDVSVMSTELATLCAGSVSVGETLAKTVQVVVQGDHVSKIVPYLHSKGVHKNHIVVLK